MAVPLLIALKTIAEIGAAVQAVNGAYNFFEDKVKDVDKSQIILETVRRQMAQYQAEMEEQARIMKERKAFLEAEGRDTSSVAYVNAKTDYDNARNKYFATEAQLAKLRNQEATLLENRLIIRCRSRQQILGKAMAAVMACRQARKRLITIKWFPKTKTLPRETD